MVFTRGGLGSSLFFQLGLISASFSLCYIGCIFLSLYLKPVVFFFPWERLSAGVFGTCFCEHLSSISWSDVVNLTFIVYTDLIFASSSTLTFLKG